MVIKEQKLMSCADLTDGVLPFFFMHVAFCSVYESMYAKRRMCWCDGGQEQQSAESLIITGGKCGAFLGAVSASVRGRGGRNAMLNVAFSAAAGSGGDGVLWETCHCMLVR